MGAKPTTTEVPKYIIETSSFYWLAEDWMIALVIICNIFIGALSTGLWYLGYVLLKEIVMSFPYDYMDYLDGKPLLEDVCLVPMNRARLVEGMKSLLMNGGKKKFTDTLRAIEESSDRGDY